MKLIVCESCDAEFKISHHMNTTHYRATHCPFCGGDIDNPELETEIEWSEEDQLFVICYLFNIICFLWWV